MFHKVITAPANTGLNSSGHPPSEYQNHLARQRQARRGRRRVPRRRENHERVRRAGKRLFPQGHGIVPASDDIPKKIRPAPAKSAVVTPFKKIFPQPAHIIQASCGKFIAVKIFTF
jgi:hypothetical protein